MDIKVRVLNLAKHRPKFKLDNSDNTERTNELSTNSYRESDSSTETDGNVEAVLDLPACPRTLKFSSCSLGCYENKDCGKNEKCVCYIFFKK